MMIMITPILLAQTVPITALTKPHPSETEIWSPEPTVVMPAITMNTKPPSDAIVLFDGTSLDKWVSQKDGKPPRWKVSNGHLTVVPGMGDIETRQRFTDYQLHIEWRIPKDVLGAGQHRGNSGVFLASEGDAAYEVQILDSYRSKTYVNGQAGSVYKQYPPLVNAMHSPGMWQTYDVIWTAPRFDADGFLKTPAYVTVLMNGVLILNHAKLLGSTVHSGQPRYTAHGAAPVRLQDHRDPEPAVSFRNIWIRAL